MVLVNRYDNYGTPASTNQGRFQYTGQMWIGELGMYHYKARVYAPTLGRFLQTDPIGYADGMNLYAYVGNDPINRVDPMGLATWVSDPRGPLEPYNDSWMPPIDVVGERIPDFDISLPRDGLVIDVNGLIQDSGGGSYTKPNPTAPASTEGKEGSGKCISPTDGPVGFAGGGFDLALGVGTGIDFYRFSIPSTGAEGWAVSGSFLGGLGSNLGFSGGSVNNMGNFLGTGYRFDTGLVGGAKLIFGSDGNIAGGGGGIGAGGGSMGGKTKTRLLSSNLPICS